MSIYYGMLVVAASLFAAQFLFNQKYQKQCGSSWSAAMMFTIYNCGTATILMFAINGFRLEWSWFSIGMASVNAIVSILYSYVSIKSFSMVNLAVYSVFAMLGGMILPAVYGIVFEREAFTVIKALCIGLICVALFLTVKGESKLKKGLIYYMLVFFLNGMNGVIQTIHRSGGDLAVDSGSYSVWVKLMPFLICIIILLVKSEKIALLKGKVLAYTTGYAAFNGIGTLLLLIALNYLPASVQYPIITGGTIVFSTVISAVRKEKVGWRNITGMLLALISTILIAI